MMTIKEFARLCSCTTQTLRYYDKIDLLKPVKVDQWSGYRYYEPAQAIDFVKIKNLQAADFSISEIKTLLTKSDRQVYEAFESKIEEQEQKLGRIREIQQSYLTEKNNMEIITRTISDFLLRNCTNMAAIKEFGFTEQDAPRVLTRLQAYFDRQVAPASRDVDWDDVTLMINNEYFHGEDEIKRRLSSLPQEKTANSILLKDSVIMQFCDDEDGRLDPGECETVWEKHGWQHVYEFIDDIPVPEVGSIYWLRIRLAGSEYESDLSFAMFMLGAVLLRLDTDDIAISCSADRSPDSENHFSLLKKR